MPDAPEIEARAIQPQRLAEIRALKFTTGLNPACGVFATGTERELYRLAATSWNALQDLLRDHAHLTAAHADTAERLAQWEGTPDQ
ncbi:hypothetical protein [Streptomyces cyslabdanicus]|uniref:hypothetical protein n=1 Tax=Streptomyces cyslabdanicus TaxID=1470456 RepID=UPI004044CB3D